MELERRPRRFARVKQLQAEEHQKALEKQLQNEADRQHNEQIKRKNRRKLKSIALREYIGYVILVIVASVIATLLINSDIITNIQSYLGG